MAIRKLGKNMKTFHLMSIRFLKKTSLYLAEWCEYVTSFKSILRCFGMIPCSHDQKCDGQ